MGEENYDIEQLYRNFLDGQCNRKELQVLLDHFVERGENTPLCDTIRHLLEQPQIHPSDIQQRAAKVVAHTDHFFYSTLLDHNKVVQTRTTYRYRYRTIVAVALVLLSCGLGLFYFQYRNSGDTPVSAAVMRYGGDADPGSNRATLTLSDGNRYELSEEQTGVVIDGEGIRYEDGKVIAKAVSASLATITTPRGGEYRLTLSDGSQVWINAASKLVYPLQFMGAERRVELEGEAYFSVKNQDNQPFVVYSQQQQVKVLGTEFMVRNYMQEAIQTTLVSGKVAVNLEGDKQDIVLLPGQQLNVDHGTSTVRKVNTSSYTGWKDGMFIFHDLSLVEVLSQLEKWYDIEVQHNDVPYITIYGEIHRNTKLSEVLELLEVATGKRFEIKERRLLIKNS